MAKKNNEKNKANEGKGGDRKLIVVLFALVIVLIVALIIVIAVMACHNKSNDEAGDQNTSQEFRGVIVSDENAEQLAEEMANSQPTQPGYYTVAMTTGWHFKDSSTASYDAYVANKPENTNNVYFDLFLSDDRENPIYRSPVISLGAELEQIKLERDLPKGEYQCVMVYHLVDENQNTVDTVEFAQQVFIEN